ATLGGISGSTLLTVTPASVVSIAVNPAIAAIPLGLTQAFTALGTFSDGSTQDVTNSVHWSSSVAAVATVSNTPGSNGIATSTGSGATVISATLGGVAGSGSLTVTAALLAAIEISPQSPSISTGGTQQFTAIGLYTDGSTPNITTTANWASSSATVATISNTSGSQGLATSAGSGTAEISASVGPLTASTTLTVQDQLVSISVTPASSVITPGAVQQFTAVGTYLSGLVQNLTNFALWSSSNPAVATITAGGTALSVGSGQTVVTASVGSVSGSSTLAVTPIQHVVIIFQENRTPDNLFQDPVLISNGADIQNFGVNSKGRTIPLSQIDLGTAGSNPDNYDLSHAHSAFVAMCDLNTSTGVCAMDGADHITVSCSPGVSNCAPANPQFMYVKPSDVQPYFQIAEQYTFGDRMFQTNQGPSFPAHQFIISGTSAPTASSTSYAAENPVLNGVAATVAGCIAPPAEIVSMINPAGNESSSMYPCFEHQTLTDLLEAANITWRYYAPTAGSIWTAPNAIQHMCGPNVAPPNATECTGSDWTNNVVISTTQNPAQVLTDIANGRLASVSWVIPSGLASDHARSNDGGGPSWVASVVNAIGSSPYWSNTAIIITWDDWGGWYDHVAPPILNSYEYGFRVPLIVVSPYAKQAYVSHVTHDFGSILKFIEGTFNLPSLGYADVPADDLSDCFNFTQTPTPFQTIAAPLNADYFLNDKRPPADPDDD
ncbi:MAG: alkaline phosphatase family protein, partial [Candidatus Sulfotelmatobacter sp.]